MIQTTNSDNARTTDVRTNDVQMNRRKGGRHEEFTPRIQLTLISPPDHTMHHLTPGLLPTPMLDAATEEEKLPQQFGVRSGIPRATVWDGAKTKDFQPPDLKSFCEKGGLTKTAPDHCRWDSTNKIQQIHLLAALKLDPDLDGNPPYHPSAPPLYNSATPSESRPQPQASSETARPEMPGPSQDSTTKPPSPQASI
ncbi:uncharacterized protein LOC108875510 [Xyrichtys novacula]|uniref:Uncharacterized protein LOC108875510 n=1 Tax=Xyrichtys novacula TaxID=13765 RepID=A0AAV1F3G1_XYRNO|nr:uncharacterized protein LOC108875510 [Xyrichtys novacula]